MPESSTLTFIPIELRREVAAIDEAIIEADQGVFISGEVVDRWLASWGTSKAVPPPAPDIFLDERQ